MKTKIKNIIQRTNQSGIHDKIQYFIVSLQN